MSNSEKMIEAVKEIGLYFKSEVDDIKEEKSSSDNISAKIRNHVESLKKINDFITKMDCIFMKSTIYDKISEHDSLDITSLLYYQSTRTKLCMSMENINKVLELLVSNASTEGILDGVDDLLKELLDAGKDSLLKYK